MTSPPQPLDFCPASGRLAKEKEGIVMKDKNRNKKINPAVAVIAVFLWVIVLTIVLHAYCQQGGTLAKVVEVALIVLTMVGFIACIVIYVIPIRRLTARIDKAAFQYQLTHDGEAYLAELEECKEMPGVKRAVFYDVPAKDYLGVLKIRALREMGRTAESRALLETVKQETTNDLTRQALKTEEEQLP